MKGACPHCGAGILIHKGSKAKLRTSIVVLHKSGDVETNCTSCKKPILLPCQTTADGTIRKASEPRLIVPLDRTAKAKP